MSVTAALPQYATNGHPATATHGLRNIIDAVTAGIKAAPQHGYRGARHSNSINTIKDISLATAKSLAPSQDDEALASIFDTVSASILSGLNQRGNDPSDVVVAAIEDAVSKSGRKRRSTTNGHPATATLGLRSIVDAVTAGIKAAPQHGFQARSGNSINTIKDISLASAKALSPSADDAALASIFDTVSASILSGLNQRGNNPADVVNAAIEDAVSKAIHY